MLALIVLFPLLGFVVNASLGRRLPKTLSASIASAKPPARVTQGMHRPQALGPRSSHVQVKSSETWNRWASLKISA